MDLVTLPNGLEIDKRCYDALMDMIDGCYDAGLTPVICSAYRTQDFQQTLYDNKVSEWMEQGYSREEAREKAGHQVAVPGTKMCIRDRPGSASISRCVPRSGGMPARRTHRLTNPSP